MSLTLLRFLGADFLRLLDDPFALKDHRPAYHGVRLSHVCSIVSSILTSASHPHVPAETWGIAERSEGFFAECMINSTYGVAQLFSLPT